MKINFPNRIPLPMNRAICLSSSRVQVGQHNAPVLSPITAGITPEIETIPSMDFTGIKATRTWRIALIPKFKHLRETGKLSSYWRPTWKGATFYFTLEEEWK